MVGRAQKAFQHLGEDAKVNYAGVKAGLRICFEPKVSKVATGLNWRLVRRNTRKVGLILQRICACYQKRHIHNYNPKLVSV